MHMMVFTDIINFFSSNALVIYSC